MMKKMIVVFSLLLAAPGVFAEEKTEAPAEKQRTEIDKKEIDKREEAIKTEMQRLEELKQDIEADIERNTALLKQIEKSLEDAQTEAGKRLNHLAKAYEAMEPEDAADRLAGLDNPTQPYRSSLR